MSTGHQRVTRKPVTLPPGVDRLPSGALRVRVYGPDGKRRLIGTYRTEREAKDALAKARTELLQGSYVERKKAEATLDTWMDEWMPQRPVRPNTLHKDTERYRLHIKPYLGHLALNKITTYQVSTWLGQLERDGRNVATRKKAHTLLSTSLGLHGAMGDQRIHTNPCQTVRAPLPDRPEWTLLTRDQFEQLYNSAEGVWRPILLVAAFAGLRWSEIAGLQAKDITPQGLRVERGLTYTPKQGVRVGPTKGRSTRTVPLTPRLRTALEEHLAAHPTVASGWLFTIDGQPIATWQQTGMWKKIRKAAGVDCRFHDLRHSCISWLLAGGATLADCRDFAGHSSVTVTELYLHVDRDTFAKTVTNALG